MDEKLVKKCSTCEVPRPLQHFTYDKKKKRYRSRCKECRAGFRRTKQKTDRRKTLGRNNPRIHPEILDMIAEMGGSEDKQEEFYKELERKKQLEKLKQELGVTLNDC